MDGKVARGTCDRQGQGGLHLVSAWATANGVTLGQVSVADNEIVAIPQLLEVLALQGCIVTLDAIGCQKKIVQAIEDHKATYIITVKDNQPTLAAHLQASFAAQDAHGWEDKAVARTEETGHGRHEIRQCWILPDTHADALGWQGCKTLIRIERITPRGQTPPSHETHYYISSVGGDAATLLQHIRDHWVLDVVFKEDGSRTRYADHNLAVLRKIALNLVRQHPAKGSLKGKRYRAGLNEDFLTDVLQSSFNLMR